jgi:hypothetical protein
MTRFPSVKDEASAPDPVKRALEVAREACEAQGLEFHLASDRQRHDDLWFNVAGHMWACKYGIALFEKLAQPQKGINLNLTLEVGSMLMAGRRCALLKDKPIEQLPSAPSSSEGGQIDSAARGAQLRARGWSRG